MMNVTQALQVTSSILPSLGLGYDVVNVHCGDDRTRLFSLALHTQGPVLLVPTIQPAWCGRSTTAQHYLSELAPFGSVASA